MKSDVWKFLRVSEDVEKKLVTYDFKIIGEGEDVVSFILGNIGKIDDAIKNFKANEKASTPRIWKAKRWQRSNSS